MTGQLKSPGSQRRVAVGAVLVVAVAVMTGILVQPRPGPTPSPSSEESGSPPPTEAPWAAVELPDVPSVADLTPSSRDDTGIRPGTTFALTSRIGGKAVDLTAGLEVIPAIRLATASIGDGTQAILTPAVPLQAGQTYRFALRLADGSLAGSWAFRVRSPLHVLSTIPADHATNVPPDFAVEFTFDQEGAAPIAPYFSISPDISGRFEQHGRTQVFVPDSLKPATLYTARVRKGLPRTGTDLALDSDVVIQFETSGPSVSVPHYRFGREVVETGPAATPVMAVDPGLTEGQTAPTAVDVLVYRLPNEVAAADALAKFLAAPRWSEYTYPRIDTDGLPLALRFSPSLAALPDTSFRLIRFPEPLPVGWYVVQLPGPGGADAFLQVTTVSAWVSVMNDKTVVWANDVARAAPIAGATVAVSGSAPFATTDGRGVAIAPTPDALIPPAEAGGREVPVNPPLLVVRSPRGEAVLVPFEVPFDPSVYRGEWWEQVASADATFWSLLHTDRSIYRATDRIEAWGYLRGRDDGTVPASVELQLVLGNDARSPDAQSLVSVRATPSAVGAYTATLPFVHLPLDWYALQAVVDGRVVSVTYLEVGLIRKPAYQLTLATDHAAVIAGSPVQWMATASFFDDSPVSSLGLKLEAARDAAEEPLVIGPTDATGRASVSILAPSPTADDSGGWSSWNAWLSPAGPEEGVISATADVLVFPSTDYVAGTGTLRSSQLTSSGTVSDVDLVRVERELAARTWDDNPAGAPIAGRAIKAVVTELIPTRRQTGTYYDFIEKVVRPRYEYDTQRKVVRTLALTSSADGSFSFTIDVPAADHAYEVTLSTRDAAGRTARRMLVIGETPEPWRLSAGIAFQTTSGRYTWQDEYAVGDRIAWRMTDNTAALPSGGSNRYLYIVAQRGLVDVATSLTPAFNRTFKASDAPGIFVMGIRFTGETYAPKAASWAVFKRSSRALDVAVTADQPVYRPGGKMTLTIRTTDPAGRPTPAEVIVQVVDEKLFAIDGARAPMTLDELYTKVDSGIVRLTSTHQLPSTGGGEGEGGDTTGGGERNDFRDTLASRSVTTGVDGLATTTVLLSDDLTSWHVLASAVTGHLETGVGEVLVPVGLPLWADVTLADGYLLSDRPTIRLRAYGGALRAGDPVEYTVSAPSLGLASTVIRARAFTDVPFELPPLRLGRHDVHVSVVAPTRLDSAGRPLRDSLKRPIDVVASRLTKSEAWYGTVGDALPSVDSPDAATYTFTDAGRGRYLQLLLDASEPAGLRLDRALAQDLARTVLISQFGSDPLAFIGDPPDPGLYTIGQVETGDGTIQSGAGLVPHAGPDPWLAARLAMLDPTGPIAGPLLWTLEAIRDDGATLRDLRIAALAGLAALGSPVDADLRDALAMTDLTPDERLSLGMGLMAIGDHAAALELERGLLRAYGQRLGGWVRLRIGATQDEAVDATARLAVLAAGLGDPLAPAMIDFVVANPSSETSNVLELVAAAAHALERTPAATASFAYVLDGTRHEVTIQPGDAMSLVLTDTQRRSFRLESVFGKVGVVISWRASVDVSALPTDPALELTRDLPSVTLAPDRIVTVNLTARFTAAAPRNGCYEVVEQVPSGLAPLVSAWTTDTGVIWPTTVVGQEVRFCAPNQLPGGSTAHLRYVARVVNAGTFTWEPAIMQLGVASELSATSPAGSVTIRPK